MPIDRIEDLGTNGALRVMRALDNKDRMTVFQLIADARQISFRQLYSDEMLNQAEVGYHLAILKAAGLVEYQVGVIGGSPGSTLCNLTTLGKEVAVWLNRTLDEGNF